MIKKTISYKDWKREEEEEEKKKKNAVGSTGPKSLADSALSLWAQKSPIAAQKLKELAAYRKAGNTGLTADTIKQLQSTSFFMPETVKDYNPYVSGQAYRDQLGLTRLHRNEGIWDVAGNSPSVMSNDFLKRQLAETTAKLGVTQAVDKVNSLNSKKQQDAYDKARANSDRWGQLYKDREQGYNLTDYTKLSKDDPKYYEEKRKAETERAKQWDNWLMAEYLLGDQTTDWQDFYNQRNDYYNTLSDEEYYKEEDRLDKQFRGLDWQKLMNPAAPAYQQSAEEVKRLTSLRDLLQKEQTNREGWQAFADEAEGIASPAMKGLYERNIQGYDPEVHDPQAMAFLPYFINHAAGGQQANLMEMLSDNIVEDLASTVGVTLDYDAKAVQGYYNKGYDYLLPEEIEAYNRLYSTDPARAQELLDFLEPQLLERRAIYNAEGTVLMAQNPVLGTLMSGASILSQPYGAAQSIYGALTGEGADSAMHDITSANQVTRQTVGEEWGKALPFKIFGEEAGTTVYNVLMSMGDMLMANTIGGAAGKAGAAAGASNAANIARNTMQTVMSSEVMAGTIYNDMQQGYTNEQAVLHGLTNGVIEAWMERRFMDELFSGKSFSARNIGSMLAEGGEEIGTDILQTVSGEFAAFLTGREGEIQQVYEQYKNTLPYGEDPGMATLMHYANQFALSGLSGMAMGGGVAAVTGTGEYLNTSSTGADVKNQGAAETILSIAEGMQDGSQAKQTAAKIREKQGKNKKVTNYQLGQVTQQLATELDEENSRIVDQVMDDAITDRLVELGEDTATAKNNASAIRKLYRGQKLTMDERLAVKWSDNATQVVKELSRETAAQDGGQRGAAANAPAQQTTAEATPGAKETNGATPYEMRRDTNPAVGHTQGGGHRGAADNAPTQQAPVTVPVTEAEGQRTGQKWVTDMQRTADNATAGVRGKIAQAQIATISPVGKAANRAEAAAKMRVPKRDGKPKQATDSHVSFKAADGNTEVSGDILRFEESEDGMNVVVQTGKGKEGEQRVKLEDWDSADGEGVATIMAYVGDEKLPHSMTAEAANTLLQAYKHSGGNAKAVIQAFDVNYLAGYSGVDQVPSVLDPTISKIAYENGKRDAEKYEANRVQRAQQARKIDTPAVGWIGDVSDNAQIRGSGDATALDGAVKQMTDGQRYVVEYGKALAQKARINVVFFNSKADPSGKFTADNGRYDRNTHTIYLDINAGINDSKALNSARKVGTLGYAMMRTLGHEVTHAIEATSVEYYAQYKQAVRNALKAKGHDWATLVRDRIDEAIAEGKTMTYGEAESEVVADASEYMLQDADFSKGLDTGIVDKIKAVVKDFVTKLNDIFRALGKSGSVESHALREMQNGVYHYMGGLQKLWGAAFEEMTGSDGTMGQQVEATTGDNEIPLSEHFNVNEDEIRHSDLIEIDIDTGSASTQSSARTWRDSDYVTKREEMAQKLASSIDVPVSKARKWIDDVSSIAAYVLDNKARVDYIPTAVKGVSAFKSNPEYGGSIDMSTICAKRRLATGTLDAIQRVLGDEVLTKDDFLRIREMMKERGHEVACGLCFVESSRKNLSKYNAQFMEQYNRTHPDGQISMTDLNTVDGLEALRLNNEEAYAEYEKFMNKLAQRKPKLFEKRTEYNHEILKKFRSDTTVGIKNLNGGMRLQSFSDFEIVHLIDMMQVITDMASVGLAGQAYTKVPDFAWALGDTGLKINLSLIAKGVDADGNLIFDDVEGMNHNDAKKLRDAYSKNVGTIVVTFTDEQLLAAMKSDMVDYIIPFHRSQWQKGDYKKLGLPEGTKDYTLHQNEKQGRKRVKENLLPNAYWDFSLSGKENAEKYLSLCASSGRTPKFAKFLVNNGDGTYILQPDGSTDGYWKLLIDFKMYDNQGNGSPQLPVQPNFNMAEAMRMLEEYKGEHDSFPVAQDVVDDFVKEYRGYKGGVQLVDGRYTLAPIQSSARRNAPDDITSRDYIAESDDSIAETVEERNALTIYQKMLKNHADASEAVMAAEKTLETAPEAKKPEARKALAAARAKQRDLYNRLLNVERTAHVQSVISRANQFMAEDLQGKTREAVEKVIADREAKIAELKADLTGLKGAAKTQREADIRQHERIVARFKSKAAQMVLENSEKYEQRIRDIRDRRDLNIEIGKKARHIKRVVKSLNDRIVHEDDYKNVKEPLKPAVHTLVRTFLDGFGNLVFDQKTTDKLKSVYDVLAQDDATVEYYDEEVSDWLTTLANLSRQDEERRAGGVTLESLNDKLYTYTTLADIADHVAHMVTAADTMFVEGKKASVSGVTEDIGNALLAKKDRRELAGTLGKAANFVDNLIIRGNMMPQFFFEGLNNSGMTQLYDGLQDGARAYSKRLLTGQNFLEDAMRRHGYHTWRDMDKKVEFKTQQGHTIHLTRENMMWIYATAKREASNPLMDTHHLDEGGFVYEESSAPTKGLLKSEGHQKHHKIMQEDVEAITEMLTAEQIAFMDECVEFLSTECAEWGNEASMQLFGIKKYKENYYFPFKVDGGQLYKNSAAGSTSTTSDARVKHISFSHSIKKGANAPLVMGEFTSVIADHINQMATYSGLVVPIENMNRVLNRKVDDDGDMVTIRSLLGRKYGSPSSKYVDDLLKDLNGGPQTDNRGTWDAGIRLFKKNAVVGKMSVAVQQPTAITRAFAYISPRWFANINMEHPKATWERMMKYSGTAVLKDMGGFNVGLGQGAKNWIERGDLGDYNVFKRSKFLLDQKGFKAAKDEWVDFLTGLPGWMDKVTWISIWNAAENEQAHQHPNMNRNSDEFLQMVGRRFDDIVNHTQVYDSILSKSQNMRSKNTLAKMATSFMAESTLNMNLAYRAFASGDIKQIGKVVSSLLLNAALGAAAYALVGAWNKDDDDRTWEEKYAVAFAGRLADNLNPMASIPYLSDIWNKIQGYDVERTDLSYVLDLAEDGMKFFDKMFNPDEALSYRDYENFVGGMFAAATGIPAKNWMGDARRIWNMTHTKIENAPSSRVWYGILDEILPGRGTNNATYYERLLAATMDGNKQEAYDLKDYLMATKGVKESTITSGVRDAYKKVYLRGGFTKNEAVSFLLENNLVTGKTDTERKKSAFEYVDKWGEGTDGYSAYNTLRKAFADGNSTSIQKAWDELEANGWSNDSIGSYVRGTIIKKMVTSGQITPEKATELIRKWYPYKKDKDNINKPKEWLKSK